MALRLLQGFVGGLVVLFELLATGTLVADGGVSALQSVAGDLVIPVFAGLALIGVIELVRRFDSEPDDDGDEGSPDFDIGHNDRRDLER